MAALASDSLRHFRLLTGNHWTEFNETWQEARSQRPLPSLCFTGWSVNKYVCLGWYFIPTKFRQNPSSGSGEEVKNVKVYGRMDDEDGRCTMTIAHLSLWLRWTNKRPKGPHIVLLSTHGPLQVLLFFCQIRPGVDPGGHRGSPSSRNFFFRPKGYSSKPNA